MIRKLFWLLGSLLLFGVAAALLAPMFISDEMVKGRIIAAVEEGTGKKLSIEGPFTITVFPVAGASAQKVTLSDNSGAFVKVDSMDVGVAVIPLLSGNVMVKSLTLSQPQIHLRVSKEGKPNWQFGNVTKEASPPSNEKSGDASAPWLKNVLLQEAGIKNGTVTYDNAQTGDKWTLENVSVQAKLDGLDAPFSLKGSITWNGRDVHFVSKISTLLTLMAEKATGVNAEIKSDLLAFTMDGRQESQSFKGKIDVRTSSIHELIAWATRAKSAADAAVLPLELSASAGCSKTSCDMPEVALKLAGIDAKGSAKATFGSDVPGVDLKLATNVLDLNPFLSQDAKGAGLGLIGAAYAAEPDRGWSTEPIDLSFLRLFNAKLDVDAEGLVFEKIKIGKLSLKGAVNGGKLAVVTATDDMYGGKGDIRASADSSGAYEKHLKLTGVNLEAFLKDAANNDRLNGKADMDADLSGHGKNQMEMVSTLQGQSRIKITDGAIKGANIADMMRNVQSAFTDANRSAQKTDFSELSGSFTINRGIAHNEDLMLKSPMLRVSGAGDINLPQRTIAYRLTPQLTREREGAEAKAVGFTVPVIVEGRLDNPSYRPDVQGIVQEAIKNPEKLKEQIKNSKETIKDLKQQLKGGGLKDLLKQF